MSRAARRPSPGSQLLLAHALADELKSAVDHSRRRSSSLLEELERGRPLRWQHVKDLRVRANGAQQQHIKQELTHDSPHAHRCHDAVEAKAVRRLPACEKRLVTAARRRRRRGRTSRRWSPRTRQAALRAAAARSFIVESGRKFRMRGSILSVTPTSRRRFAVERSDCLLEGLGLCCRRLAVEHAPKLESGRLQVAVGVPRQQLGAALGL
eukprot:4901945-Pleurochrysis_carterae.AAC.2